MSGSKTSLHANPFAILQISTRDNSHKIVDSAEERSLIIDHDLCQKARSELTNPRTRLSAEISWMPGVAPRTIETILQTLEENPAKALDEFSLPMLARANLIAATFELNNSEPTELSAVSILVFCKTAESIDPTDVLRDINEDRAVAGFPEVTSVEVIEEGLAECRKFYRTILKNYLDQMDPIKLVETMTLTVELATNDGEEHAPALLDDLVDAYEIEIQGFLQKEYENISALINGVREAASKGESAVSLILDKLEKVVSNWGKVALPIQISMNSRGIEHRQSRNIAYELRRLGIDLNNEHSMLQQAQHMTELLRKIFSKLPEVAELLEGDAEAIARLRQQEEQQERKNTEWVRTVTFRADVGAVFQDQLSISPEGIHWKGRRFPLESITRVRWGAIRNSINAIPTGTNYTIAFGDNQFEQVIKLRKEATYTGFIDALWRGVCVRLLIEMLESLSKEETFYFGDIGVEDDAVTLTRHKLFGNERVRLAWGNVQLWSSNGSFFIGHKQDKKVYGSASYIESPNVHILEHIIRGSLKKGVSKLSDYLRN